MFPRSPLTTVMTAAFFLFTAQLFGSSAATAAHAPAGRPSAAHASAVLSAEELSNQRAQTKLSGDEIFQYALLQWQAHIVPTYVSFQLPCANTFLDYKCHADDDVEFVTRMADGRTSAYAISPGGLAPQRIAQGELITGPGGAPLGFFRRLGNLSVMPNVDSSDDEDMSPTDILPEKMIADVVSVGHYYDVKLAGEESVGGRRCYHLALRAVKDLVRYPLRDLWVDTQTYDIIALTYNWEFGEYQHRGTVHYRFAEVYPYNIWTIVHIDARVVTHRLLSRKDFVASTSGDLYNITFPTNEPGDDFVPEPEPTPNPVTSF